MARYKLLVGIHIQDDPVEVDGETKMVERVYRAGETFETHIDMLKFNGEGMEPKFQILTGRESAVAQMSEEEATLHSMTKEELIRLANDEDIDISCVKKKSEIIKTILKAQGQTE